MTKTIHICQSVRGAIKFWNKRTYDNFLSDNNGNFLSYEEAIDFLLEELSKGHEVIPLGLPCEGFDYKKGCPGHEE